MKQKILFLCFLILSSVFAQAYAQTVAVKSLDTFSTENPPTSITIELIEPLDLSKDLTLNAGTKVEGNLIDVVSPKRLKRDADFSFKPLYYSNGGEKYPVNSNITGNFTEPIDKGQLAQNAALSVGNFFIKGIKLSVTAVQGAVKNEQGNRLKSAGTSVYKASPVSYVEKGEEISIKESDIFYLKFPNVKYNNTEKE